jgi:mitochondrial distribution and morphology protein 12
MSFKIQWDLLKDGQEERQLKDFLNDKFSSIDRPDFLGEISIKSFSFGSIPPEIAVVDITEPMEEFYFEIDDPLFDLQSIGDHLPTGNSPENFSEDGPSRNVTDFQIEVSITYNGDMNLSIATELIVNQPTLHFLSLPIELTLTKSSFRATAILASIGNTISFCLKQPEGPEGILHEFSIESAIGDGNKQGTQVTLTLVLKNVGKIEKFILLQMQSFLTEYCVFPNYHTILMQGDQS